MIIGDPGIPEGSSRIVTTPAGKGIGAPQVNLPHLPTVNRSRHVLWFWLLSPGGRKVIGGSCLHQFHLGTSDNFLF